MKKMHLLALGAGALLATAAAAQMVSSPAGPDETQRAIMRLECEWGGAYLAGDLGAIRRIEAEEFVEINPDGELTTRQGDIDDLSSGKLKFTRLSDGSMQVRVLGNTVIVTGRSAVEGSYDGHSFSGTYAWVDTWLQRDGRWQIVAEGVTKIAPDQASRLAVEPQCGRS